MVKIELNNIELNEFSAKADVNQHCKATFPLFAAHGSRDIATVYFELDAGKNLGKHTDSAEELLVILEGEVEATVGHSTGQATKGNIILVPKMVVHDIKNIGPSKAKVLGVFGGANNIVATFENEWAPTDSKVVDTSQMV